MSITSRSRWRHHFEALAIGLTYLPLAKAATPTTLPAASQPGAAENHAHSGTGSIAGSDDLTHMSLEDLMNVEVTSVSKKKQSISEAPAAVTVISQDDISRSGFSTIPDLLRLAPGVDVARVNSYSYAVGVRGLNSQFNNNLLVMQDGRTLYSPFFAGVYWDTVDYVLEDLNRIEVIRGPGATLWGANAVNGVINITSKDSRDTQGVLVSARGSNDDSSLSFRVGDKISDDTTFRVYAKGRYDAGLDNFSGKPESDNWYSLRSGFRVDKHTSDSDTFTVQGDLGDNQIREPVGFPVPIAPFVLPLTTDRVDVNGNMLARWDHRVSEDSDFSLQTYYDYLKVNYIAANYNQNTFDIDFHDRFKTSPRNEITWGLGYRFINTKIVPGPSVTANPSTRNLNVYSTFVQDTYTLEPEHWYVTLGSKFEHNDFTGFEIQPSARLLWTPNKQNSVWAAVSRGIRTPALDERESRIPLAYMPIPTGNGSTVPGETVIFGSPKFGSENLTAYEIGYRTQPTKSLTIDSAIFYNVYGGVQSADTGTPVPGSPVIIPITFSNRIDGETYGAEISSTLQVNDRWRLAGSYSLLETNFAMPTPATGGVGVPRSSAPKNQAQVHSYFDITRNLQLNAGIFYVGRVDEFHIAGYISTDLNLIWRPQESMEVAVGVLNLFDNRHPEFGTSGTQGIASQTPRTVYAQMSYKF